ncbi:NAD(P)-dependent alcohol dehydrogenase [Porifericola rhodea]|uniref:NAD(P)-dependent alcohol dehydrogenase n=1 Tax=Porifericola rhodea TaxID=930972 RepID=UPI002666C3AD|nr:NAD(P)-dependent alcohol dehydrogenase [Porifericola rhodea]WKN31606.1 NAD(P)-dependent alcohol dehydrogenase [Porifericola rhodea]
MRAVYCTQYGSPSVLDVRSVECPLPKAHEILVKVHAASITTADAMMRQGSPRYARLFLGFKRPRRPITGTGFAGTVVAVGKNVSQFEVGSHVFGETTTNFGAHAEYVCVPENGVVLSLPSFLSYEEGALMCDGPVTSLNFLKNLAELKAGQHILINGASGSLGMAAIQIAKHMGAEVTGVCSRRNLNEIIELGADRVINYQETDFTSQKQQYDVVYDTVGKSSYAQCKAILKPNGRYVSPVLNMKLLYYSLTTKAGNGKSAKFTATGLSPVHELKKLIIELLEMIRQQQLKVYIDRAYEINQIVEAHEYIDSGHKRGNIVLKLSA